MNVEDINAELRPRSSWEAADLGAALVRRDYLAILVRQALVMIPIWALIALVLHDHPGWVYFFIWWLKPVFERISLFYLSRSLFGTKPTIGETLRAVPAMLFRNVLALLTIFRFSPSRLR